MVRTARAGGGARPTSAQLGATVRTLDLWDDPSICRRRRRRARSRPRAWCSRRSIGPIWPSPRCARSARSRDFDNVGALIAVTVGQIARVDPSSGFDDFVLHPYVPEELYGRIRALEWRRSEFATEERHKVGQHRHRQRGPRGGGGRPPDLAHRQGVRPARVPLRAPRQGALVASSSWRASGAIATKAVRARSTSTFGGLRAKLGDALPLETLRGVGLQAQGA